MFRIINSWMDGRKKLELVGPPKPKAYHEMFVNFFREDFKYRMKLVKSIVVSGDTDYCENIVKLAKDADVLILDTTNFVTNRYAGASTPNKRNTTPKEHAQKNFEGSHSSLDDVAQIAREANVKKLVLTHQVEY